MSEFDQEIRARVRDMNDDAALAGSAQAFLAQSIASKYSYNFHWLGRPIIQYPQDIVALQEIIWASRPDLIIETGIAHGGSLVLSASMLALLDLCDGANPKADGSHPRRPRSVVGIDIDIRPHNRKAIEEHPLADRITLLQGSSIASDIFDAVRAEAAPFERVMVMLDSNHTHDHVLAELNAYADLVTPGCYCIVYDTVIEDLDADSFSNRPWGPGDNPRTAALAFLKSNPAFAADLDIDTRLQISVARHGYLKRL